MAIAFAHVSIHSRSKGHSAVAASAYRSGTCLVDERTGLVHDFSHRSDVMYSELLLPEKMSASFQEREFLWNQLEACEKRKDSQLCKDIVLALPKELDFVHQIELAKRFAQTHFVENGLPADISIHDHGDGNPHAHILIPTRRLESEGFSKYKARDLNPSFACGNVVEKEIWGEQWRYAQETFFKEKNIDLAVDLNHVIPERHEGNIRGGSSHYIKQDNDLIREARIEVVLHDIDNLINKLSSSHSVFTRRDVQTLLFKTLKTHKDNQDYLSMVEQVLGHKNVIALGANDKGLDSYTTRYQYIAEAKLLHHVEQMQSRFGHVFRGKVDSISCQYTLNDEQREALDYIAKGNDLSVLIGRPGVGKSYLLKPLKAYYEANGCRVIGAALSGKVAKSLQAETAIQSYTIASLSYRLAHYQMQLREKDIIIIDEAGMVDFPSLSFILDAADKAKAKVVLVGDPDQLKPINKGEIFRGIAARAGFIELGQIRRQRDEGDRAASLAMARGDITAAITHYERKNAIHFDAYSSDAATHLVADWQRLIKEPMHIQENMMFAFSRAAVLSLNEQGREALQQKGLVSREEFLWQRTVDDAGKALQPNDKVIVRFNDKQFPIKAGDVVSLKALNKASFTIEANGQTMDIPNDYLAQISLIESRDIRIAQGERLLLRKNDKDLGVRNGDMAWVESVNDEQITARLDSGERITIPKSYKYLDYGYATTVHKGQGMTVDSSSILIDSQYWDRSLSFVAMTRHRERLAIYADKHQHPDMEALCKTLSRSVTKDNVIDWPLDFAIRAGFDPDKMLGRALNRLAGFGHEVKNKWNYLVNYEAYLKTQTSQIALSERQALRAIAKEVAGYLDEKSALSQRIALLEKEAKKRGVDKSTLPGFEALYQQSLVRDKRAHDLTAVFGVQLDKLNTMTKAVEGIKRDTARFERYQSLKVLAELPPDILPTDVLLEQAAKVDLKKDYVHLVRLAAQYGKPVNGFYAQIERLQKAHRQTVFDALKLAHPVLNEYDNLYVERSRATGFKASQLDRALLSKAQAIAGNKGLYEKLQRDLPAFAKSLALRIKAHGLDKGVAH